MKRKEIAPRQEMSHHEQSDPPTAFPSQKYFDLKYQLSCSFIIIRALHTWVLVWPSWHVRGSFADFMVKAEVTQIWLSKWRHKYCLHIITTLAAQKRNEANLPAFLSAKSYISSSIETKVRQRKGHSVDRAGLLRGSVPANGASSLKSLALWPHLWSPQQFVQNLIWKLSTRKGAEKRYYYLLWLWSCFLELQECNMSLQTWF